MLWARCPKNTLNSQNSSHLENPFQSIYHLALGSLLLRVCLASYLSPLLPSYCFCFPISFLFLRVSRRLSRSLHLFILSHIIAVSPSKLTAFHLVLQSRSLTEESRSTFLFMAVTNQVHMWSIILQYWGQWDPNCSEHEGCGVHTRRYFFRINKLRRKPCSLGVDRRFRSTYCLHHQALWRKLLFTLRITQEP
jgi:hypothetical protein